MRKMALKIIILCMCYMCIGMCNTKVMGQNQDDRIVNELLFLEIADRLISYNDLLIDMQDDVKKSPMNELDAMNKRITSIDLKWSLYNQSNQLDIANNDSLLQIAADFQLIKQELLDSIAGKKHLIESKDKFKEIETFLFSQDSIYADIYDDALKYSKLEKLAPTLEKLKIKEQLLFADIKANYENAITIAAEFPILQNRTLKIEEKYIELKNESDKIQALEYKPFFQRIKDELIGLAAVSMILMFINVIQTKIKAWKQGVENAKKMKEMLKQNDNEYPTI